MLQFVEGIIYVEKIVKDEVVLDWLYQVVVLLCQVYVFNLFFGVLVVLDGVLIKFWQVEVFVDCLVDVEFGMVFVVNVGGVIIVCGVGVLCVIQLQKLGGKCLFVCEFL